MRFTVTTAISAPAGTGILRLTCAHCKQLPTLRDEETGELLCATHAGVRNRRDYRSGSVYQRASDGFWVGTYEAGVTRQGKRRRLYVVAKTETVCKRKLKDKIKDFHESGLAAVGLSGTTVETYATKWIVRTQKEVRPKTWATNSGTVTKWIIPVLGHRRLADLMPDDMRFLADSLSKGKKGEKPLAAASVLRAHRLMAKMLRDAAVDGHKIADGIFRMKAPSPGQNDRVALTPDDAMAVLNVVGGDVRYGSRWIVALLQGMRQGECLGLTWDRVDLVKGQLDTSWQLQPIDFDHGCSSNPKMPTCGRARGGNCPERVRVPVPPGYEMRELEGRFCLVRPKTAKGQRVIPMIPFVVEALRKWKEIAPANPHNLVWTTDGSPTDSPTDRAEWESVQARAGIAKGVKTDAKGKPVTTYYGIHEMRHTTATLLLEAGVDPKTIQEIMGHSSVLTTQKYQHVSTELARKGMDAVGTRLQLGK